MENLSWSILRSSIVEIQRDSSGGWRYFLRYFVSQVSNLLGNDLILTSKSLSLGLGWSWLTNEELTRGQ